MGIPIIKLLKLNKIENYSVSTNDSKFDDVTQIIGDDYADKKVYCITNDPTVDGTYIQAGAKHTVIGMQYANKLYGSQVSISVSGIKYRTITNGTWSNWSNMSETAWTNINLNPKWSNLSSTYNSAQYKIVGNRVYLRGIIKNSTDSTASPFTLPVGVKPVKTTYSAVNEGGDIKSAYILSSGEFELNNYTQNDFVDISLFSFYLD